MEIRRVDFTKINEIERDKLLSDYGMSASDLIAIGTEAEVYAVDEERVLKIYGDPANLPRIQVLRHFYACINESSTSLRLPRILDVQRRGDIISVRCADFGILRDVERRVYIVRNGKYYCHKSLNQEII